MQRCRAASAVRVLKHSYSVSSRLIGCQLRVRLHADIVELDYRGERVATMERLIGRDTHRIDYRHIIHALVRKPGAFRRYVFREALFPSLEFRRSLRCAPGRRSRPGRSGLRADLASGGQRWRGRRS